MKTKVCTCCRKSLPFSQFYWLAGKSIYRRQCKACSLIQWQASVDRKIASMHAPMLNAISAGEQVPTQELARRIGLDRNKTSAVARSLFRAGRLDRRKRGTVAIWQLPPPVAPGPHIILPATEARELIKLKRDSEARSAGIDDEDLRWMAYYRARAAQRQQQAAA